MRDEVLTVLSDTPNEAAISFSQLQQMRYLEAFVMEVLRLHPSVAKEAKAVHRDDVLPDGTRVRKGEIVSFVPWLMGRTEEYWPDALRFDPDRFLDKPKPSPFLFTAFQVRVRRCLLFSLTDLLAID